LAILKRLNYKEEDKNRSHLNVYNINGKVFQFYSHILTRPDYNIKEIINVNELDNKEHFYYIKNMNFKKGDVVLDIGANIGIFSIYLAKLFPEVKIYAFEPVKKTYNDLLKNIELNNIKNIKAFNLAVNKDAREIQMIYLEEASDCSFMADLDVPRLTNRSNIKNNVVVEKVPGITLDGILKDNKIQKVKLLKIDTEGAEDEILRASKRLNDIEYIIGEMHYNSKDPKITESLKNYLSQYFDEDHMKFEEV
jgi:FkbM family methyltransferase